MRLLHSTGQSSFDDDEDDEGYLRYELHEICCCAPLKKKEHKKGKPWKHIQRHTHNIALVCMHSREKFIHTDIAVILLHTKSVVNVVVGDIPIVEIRPNC